nr:MAG TPA: hypothetical protein [Caudoviricetes sp.]
MHKATIIFKEVLCHFWKKDKVVTGKSCDKQKQAKFTLCKSKDFCIYYLLL